MSRKRLLSILECINTLPENITEVIVGSRHMSSICRGQDRVLYLEYVHKLGYAITPITAELAARFGRLECLQYIDRFYPEYLTRADTVYAAVSDFPCFEYLYQCMERASLSTFFLWNDYLAKLVSEAQNIEVIKFMSKLSPIMISGKGLTWECIRFLVPDALDSYSNYTLVSLGDIDVLKYLEELGVVWNTNLLFAAVYSGSYECVHYLINKHCPLSINATLVATQNTKILKLLCESGCTVHPQAIITAVEADNVESMMYLMDLGAKVTHVVLGCCGNAVKCMSKLESLGYSFSEKTVLQAARYNNLACLKKLKIDSSVDIISHVTDLECARYLKSIGCRVTKSALIHAVLAKKNRLFKFLYAENPIQSAILPYQACKTGRARILSLLIRSGCPINMGSCLRAAAIAGHLDCMRILVAHNAPMLKIVDYVVYKNGDIRCIRFLVKNGYKYSLRALRVAHKRQRMDILQCLYSNAWKCLDIYI